MSEAETSVHGPAAADGEAPAPRGGIRPLPGGRSITAYMIGLAVLFLAAVVTITLYQHRAATDDAVEAAAEDAAFAARLAALAIDEEIATARATVASTAATPGLDGVFTAPEGCQLTFAATGAFGSGHVDVVSPDGAPVCSSLAATADPVYGDAAWLSAARSGPVLSAPVVDERTGRQAVVVGAPIPTGGAVVVFLDLDTLGPSLTETLGGPRGLEFVISSGDAATVLSRSLDPTVWIGRDPAGSGFRPGAPGVDRRDLDGTRRLYGTATVAATGWHVDAGASRADAVAPAETITRRDVALGAGFLGLFLIAGYVVQRRIGRPLRRLSADVRTAAAREPAASIAPDGPAEVRALAHQFASLIDERDRELRSKRRATSALAESEHRLQTVLDNSPAIIHMKDLDGRYVFVNRCAEQLAGRTREEMIGREDAELLPAEIADARRAIAASVLERREPIQAEETLSIGDAPVTYLTVTFPLVSARGEAYGTAAIGTDITELKRSEHERSSLQARLNQSQRLESLGQLAGGVAHDFNNLLGVILNYAGFVAEQTDGAVRSDVGKIKEAAERAARLTHQLLVFARRETVRPQRLDLNVIVESIRGLLDRTIGEDIELEVRTAQDLPAVRADRGQVDQILLNLAVNARDAMPDGGTLSLETRCLDLDEEYARLNPGTSPGRHVQLVVSDTGVGMPPEVAARAFEPFFSTKRSGHGTGLGLATVYGIVTEAGGSVHVYSEEGLGTTFRVNFPVADVGADVDVEAPALTDDRVAGHETVLVVEDEPAMLELTSRLLTRNGYTVLEAGSAAVAVELAAQHHVDLLLTDSVMPSMSGATLTDVLKEGRPDLAVLFMSGYSHGVLGPRRLLADDVRLIQKPFTESELLTKVRETLQRA